jgi:hypothetical protein
MTSFASKTSTTGIRRFVQPKSRRLEDDGFSSFPFAAETGRQRPTANADLDLTARRLASDLVNIGPIDADILQLAIRIGREFVQYIPVTPTLFQESRNE